MSKKLERQINLLAYLLNDPYGHTFQEIKNNVSYYEGSDETVRRKFERDKADLKNLGVSLQCEADVYTVDKPETYLKEIKFTNKEIALLNFIARISRLGNIPLGMHFWPAMLKLSFNEPEILQSQEYCPPVLFDWSQNDELLGSIYEAILSRGTATFKYKGIADKKPKDRKVDIYGTFFYVDSWFFAGRCHTNNAIRCFNTKRVESNLQINDTNPKAPDYKIPADFNVRKLLNRPWEWGQAKEQTVILACNANIFQVIGRQLGNKVSVIKTGKGEIEFSLNIRNADNFIKWILANKCECRIMSPPQLRKRLKDWLSEIKNLYEEETAVV